MSYKKSPTQNHREFNEDTIYGTPVPQAASTANREGDNRYSVDLASCEVPKSVKNDRIMEDAASKIGDLQQMLQAEFERMKRLSTTSSLGILKNNEIESVSAIFDIAEVSTCGKQNKNNEPDRCDRKSSLYKRTLPAIEGDFPVQVMSAEPESDKVAIVVKGDMDFELDTSGRLPSLNINSKENLSMQSEQFFGGESVVKLLNHDEEEWLKNRAELPLASQDKSLSGIYSDNSCISNRLSMLSFLRKGSHPLGSSLSDITKSDERPCFGREIKSPGKKYRTHGMPVGSDEIPVKQESSIKPVETSQPGPWTLSALMEQYSVIHDNDGSKSDESMSRKSTMSISRIANMLENMTCTSPRDLFDKVMKQASVDEIGNRTANIRKDKENINKNMSGRQKLSNTSEELSNETDIFESKIGKELMSRKNYELYFGKDSSNINEMGNKSANGYREKENVAPNKIKSSRQKLSNISAEMITENLSVASKKQKERELLLSKNYQEAFGKRLSKDEDDHTTSVTNLSRSSSVYSLSFNSSLFGKEDDCKSVENGMLERLSATHDSVKSHLDKYDHYKLLSESFQSAASETNIHESDINEVGAIPVCIGTPITMDFDLNNDRDTEQHCTITKDALVDGKSNKKAAIIKLDSSEVILKPHEQRMISIIASPLVPKEVTIRLTIRRVDAVTGKIEFYHVCGKVLGEFPVVKILNEKVDFGKLPEDYTIQQIVEIMNFGQAIVPLNIFINQCSYKNGVFYLDYNRSKSAEVVLHPGEKCQQTVVCCSPLLSGNQSKKPTELSASLNLSIKIPSSVQLPEFEKVLLTSCVLPCSLKFSSPLNHVIQMQPGSDHKIWATNISSVLLNVAASVDVVGFHVEPNMLKINSDEKVCFCVKYRPLNRSQSRKVTLTFQVLPSGRKYEFCLVGETGSKETGVNLVTPESSRAPSPLSPTSSTGSAVGSFQLQCNYKELVWGNCALHTKNIKNCVFRNRSMHREKVLLRITDSHKCFKILKEQKKMDYQLHMSLQPMESTVVSVVMLPTFVGSMKGVLSITRIGKESERREKNVLPLYGYGGKSRLVLHRVLRNPDQQMWIYLDSDTLSYKFSIRNDGDAAAFIKISQGIEATGVSLSPPECIVDANSEVEVEVSLSATPDRLEHLLQKPSDSVIRVVALTVMHGDEAALHRLRRLYLTYDFDLSDISTACHSSLPALIGLFANRESDTLILKDPKASLETLWQDGIHQWNIGVLVERSVLEAMRLDTSLDFTGLRTDLEETTYNVTSLTVSPESLSLSLSSSSQDLLLLNSDSRNIGFHCVASQGLQVNPQYGRINSKSSMKLRVHWDSIIKSKEPLEVKVLTAHGCEIIVPVKCR